MAYPCNLDQWEDGMLGEVYDYLINYKNLKIPDMWTEAIGTFHREYMEIRNKVSLIDGTFCEVWPVLLRAPYILQTSVKTFTGVAKAPCPSSSCAASSPHEPLVELQS